MSASSDRESQLSNGIGRGSSTSPLRSTHGQAVARLLRQQIVFKVLLALLYYLLSPLSSLLPPLSSLLSEERGEEWTRRRANREYTREVLDRITTLEEAKLTLQRTQAVAMMAQRMSMAKSEDECLHLVSKLLVALFDVPRSSVALLTPDKQHCEGVQMAIVKENMANVCLVKFSEWSSCYSLMPPRRAAPFINN